MKESPKNKMIGNKDELTKGASDSKNLGKQVKKFYFPHLKRTVVAASFEEAKDIINNEVVK